MPPEVLILVGPTASGKSAVAYELAQRVPAEIISADSMQVYRGVPILTQQPPLSWQERVPHHLIGLLDLSAPWSAASFRTEALRLIHEIRARARLPIIVGGTGLYIRALLDGLCEAPAANPRIRQRLVAEMAAQGSLPAHHRLAAVDPVAASKIHPHDARRIIRALEVYETTGEPLSRRWQEQPRAVLPFTYALVGLDCPRPLLYARINARVEQMFAQGVIEEVRALDSIQMSHTAQQMLGLAVIREHVTLQRPPRESQTLLQQQTRQYARRQLIWFRREPRLHWIPAGDLTPAAQATGLLRRLRESAS